MRILLLISAVLLLASCATGYVKVNPETTKYGSSDEKDGLKIEYKYDVLQKKYAKKEKKKGVKLVAAKIINSTSQDVVLGKNVRLQSGAGNEILLLDNEQIYKPLKQNIGGYFLYLLFTPFKLYQTKENNGIVEQEEIFPIGYILGPGLTALNVITASNGNSKFKEELAHHNLFNKTIKAGDTVSGIIGIRTNSFENLKIIPVE